MMKKQNPTISGHKSFGKKKSNVTIICPNHPFVKHFSHHYSCESHKRFIRVRVFYYY
jgi:hypothetical protein